MCLELRLCDDTVPGGKESLVSGDTVPGGWKKVTPWNCLVTARESPYPLKVCCHKDGALNT